MIPEQRARGPLWYAPEVAKAGYRVFPIAPDQKRSSVPGSFYSSTTDASQIAAWLEEGREHHLIGIATGFASDLVVIEADRPETYEEMQDRLGEPDATSRRGGHWYLKHPGGGKVVSRNIKPGLDCKADGGIVVCPPGKNRQWTKGIPEKASLRAVPVDLIQREDEPEAGDRERSDEECERAAEAIARRVLELPEGKRHFHMNASVGVALSRGVSDADAAYIHTLAWKKTGDPELMKRAAQEGRNAVKTTRRALANGRNFTGIPTMERLTPGLYEELAGVMGWLYEIKPDGRKRRPGDNSVNSDNTFEDLKELPDPEEFPVRVLPPSVGQLVREAAASLGCPTDFLAVGALSAMSAAIGDTRRVAIKSGWTEGAAIYGMIVGGAASKKTPALYEAVKPVLEMQLAHKAEYERQKQEYEAALERWDPKENPDGKPKKPKMKRSFVDDTTVEKLADILNENPRGVGLIKDELSGWLGSMDQYKQGGRGGDRQKWLQIHTNRPISVDRKSTEEPVIVPRPYVSIVGGIQPEVLTDFGKDRGDGLMDRFVAAYPTPRHTRWTDEEISDQARAAYSETIKTLYRLEPAEHEGDKFASQVSMSGEAKSVFVAEYNKLHEELESPGFPQRLRPVYGKLEAYLARFSLILAMGRCAEAKLAGQSVIEKIIREDMEGAGALLSYFKNHARRVYTGLYGDNPSDNLAADLRDFLVDRDGIWEGTASELFEALESDYKPARDKDFGKALRAISKRSPLLHLEDLQRTKSRRPFRLTLKSVVTVDTVVTPSPGEPVREVW